MSRKLMIALIAAACAATPAFARQMRQEQEQPQEQTKKLAVGDKAPPLSEVTWIQGEEVSEYQSGQVYVLDFWATWCGPCIASIPHINQMHNEYKDKGVHIIGVAIWPRAGMTPTEDFVESRGEAMAYRIAADIDGKTAEAYMKASGQNGIPTAMVVDQEGKIAWIGHPMDGLDEVVELVHANKFDAKAYAARQAELKAKAAPLEQMLRTAYRTQNWEQVASACEKLIALDAKKFAGYGVTRYEALSKFDQGAARAYGRTLIRDLYAKDDQSLNALAWGIVDPAEGRAVKDMDLDIALEAAEKGCELTDWKDPMILDTLARVHFHRGDIRRAIELQTQAVDLADENFKDSLREALEEYKNALTEA